MRRQPSPFLPRTPRPLAARTLAGMLAGVLLAGCGADAPGSQSLGDVGPSTPSTSTVSPPASDMAGGTSGGSDAGGTAELPPEEQPLTRIESGTPEDLVASGLLLPDFTPTYGEFGPVYGDGIVSVVQGIAPGELEEMTATCRDIAVAAGWTVTSEYEFGVNTGFMAERDGDQLHYMLAERDGGGLDIRIGLVLF
jgi:hypothetical protein